MLELGKPIHTFDAAEWPPGPTAATGSIVRRARARRADRDAGPRRADARPGHAPHRGRPRPGRHRRRHGRRAVRGRATARPTSIVESAIFDPVSIRRTGQRYALRCEASLRFEKGQEFRLARLGADRTARLIARVGRRHGRAGRVDTAPDEPGPSRVAFRPSRVNRLLGTEIPDGPPARASRPCRHRDRADGAADRDRPSRRGPKPLTITSRDETLLAVVPTWRRDIAIEADVAEEVARVRGYEPIPRDPARHADAAVPRPRRSSVRDTIRETLAGAGPHRGRHPRARLAADAPTRSRWDVAGRRRGGRAPPRAAADPRHEPALAPTTPSCARRSSAASLEVVSTNLRHGVDDVAIFEVGKGYGARRGRRIARRSGGGSGSPSTGAAEPAGLEPPAARPYDLDDAKGLVELLAARLGFDAADATRPLADEPLLHPGRAARVEARRDGGSCSPASSASSTRRVADAGTCATPGSSSRSSPIAGLAGGPPPRHAVARRRAPGRRARPRGRREGATSPPATSRRAIRGAAGPAARRPCACSTSTAAAPLAADEKSLAYRLTFQPTDRTLDRGRGRSRDRRDHGRTDRREVGARIGPESGLRPATRRCYASGACHGGPFGRAARPSPEETA